MGNLLSLINLGLTIAAILVYIGVDHQRIATIDRDLNRLELRLDYLEEHGSRGTPERLGEIERRVGRMEDKIDILIKVTK